NWARKKDIFARTKVYIAAPSSWLMAKVQESLLAGSALETRVIPNGVDLTVFCPGISAEERRKLDLPTDAFIAIFASNGIRKNMWKDYKTLRNALGQVGSQVPNGRLML